MTDKKKFPKKQKLRNAEYYDMQSVFDKLYADSKKGLKFTDLVEIIKSPENIKLAYRNMRKNKGSKTAGTDKKTISDLDKWKESSLIAHVQRKLDWYIPQKVRRVKIPKDNGKTRPLGIPTIMDRLIQQCVLQVLEPICEAKFFERSNGFRPNRSAENAVAQAERMMQNMNLHYVVDVDIKSFFDNVSHGKLLKQMWTMGIQDKKLLCIISAMLKAEVAGIGFPEKGTPQGGIISPLLSNIVINELDWWVASQWENIPTRENYIRRIYANGTPDKSRQVYHLRKTALKECYIVRYADDFKIFCRKRSDAVKMFEATKLWLKDRLGLEISPEKSKIVNLKRHYSEFLGFKLKVREKGKNKQGQPKYVVEAHIKEKKLAKIKAYSKEIIGKIRQTYNTGKSITADSIVKITASHEVFAKWTQVVPTITFDAKGGTAEMDTKQVVMGKNYGVLPDAEKADCEFIGWFMEDGTEITSSSIVEIAEDTTVYAKWRMKGDADADGDVDIDDVIMLQHWLLAVPDAPLTDWQAVDLCQDERIDVFDLCLLKRLLIERNDEV